MATTVTKTIGSGGDYANMAAWIAACPANLVTADQIWRGELLNQTFSGTGNLLTISGITTDATRYVELTVAAGASFADAASPVMRVDSSKGAYVTSSVDNVGVAVIINSVAFTRFSRLQVESTVTSTAARAIVMGAAWADACIFEGATGAFGGGVVGINGGKMSNSVVTLRTGGESEIVNCNSASSTFTNCVFAVPSDKSAASTALRMSYGSVTVKNCVALGVNNLVQGTGGSISNGGGNRTSIAGNPSSWTSVTYNTALVVQTTDTGRDFSPTNSSSGLFGVTADTTNAAKDILGATRPTGAGASYAGAREYGGGGGGGTTSFVPQRGGIRFPNIINF